jgi:hypothetical protein
MEISTYEKRLEAVEALGLTDLPALAPTTTTFLLRSSSKRFRTLPRLPTGAAMQEVKNGSA